ncbi:MAG: hypothetical protein RIS89_1192 [Bacteroidota bacterium]|jgi:hypothetical protein
MVSYKLNFGEGPEMGNWKFVASLSKKTRKRTNNVKNYVLRFCFLAAGNNMLFKIKR